MKWPRTSPVTGTTVEQYLRNRGVWTDLASSSLALRRGSERLGRRRCDVMYAGLRDTRTGEPRSYQRTFMSPDGLPLRGWEGDPDARVPRLSAPNDLGFDASGTAVMLDPLADVTWGLTIAEGVEAALAAAMLWNLRPIWAVPGTGQLQSFEPPAALDALTIVADSDGPGLRAAQACGDRMKSLGLDMRIMASARTGEDADEVCLRSPWRLAV